MPRPWSIVMCSALVLSACSSRRPPTAKLSTADVAIQAASDQTASQYAPLDLRLAREKLDKAQRAVDDDEYDRAERLADEAFVDAQVAEARARAAKAKANAQQTRADVGTSRGQADVPAVAR